MKIKRISCTQFAGIRNKSISLNDGINVIYGKNESGKTTIVNILSRTLFQDAKIDKRTNKDFCALYFPSDKKDGHIRGDYADGEIAFETDSGEYVLSKEWGGNPYCRLSTPSGAVRDANRINEILKTELAYGEGVYNDIILQSHKNSDAALMSLLDAAGKTDSKRELTDAVTTAFAQSDGVSVDAIGGAIEKKINEIAGAHWDFEKNIPAVNKKGRWSKGIGEIHKAYYSMEDAHETQKRIFGLEAAADEAAADYEEKEKLYREASAAAERFGEFVNRLEVRSERLKSIKRLESELKTCTEALEELPRLKKQLISARALQTEKSNRDILNKYAEAKKLKDRAAELADRLKKAVCPSSREIADAKFAAKEIEKLENKLRGMNIFAKIKMLGAHEARVELLRTGEIVDISNGGAPIDEAVKITIPEVMEMELTPADTDAAAINREIAEKKAAAAAICGKYAAEDAERLEAMADEYKILDNEAKNAAARLDMYLGDEIFENLEAVAGQISGEIRESGEIERDAAALCGRTELAGFIAGHEALIKKSEETYGGEEALAARAESIRADIEAAKEAVDKQDDIPKEYLKIQDPDRHRTALKRAADELRNERDDALKKIKWRKSAATRPRTRQRRSACLRNTALCFRAGST